MWVSILYFQLWHGHFSLGILLSSNLIYPKPKLPCKLAFFLSQPFLCCFQGHYPIPGPGHTLTINATPSSLVLSLSTLIDSAKHLCWTQLSKSMLSSFWSPGWALIKIPGVEIGFLQGGNTPGNMALVINPRFFHDCSKNSGIRPGEWSSSDWRQTSTSLLADNLPSEPGADASIVLRSYPQVTRRCLQGR